jgi:DNA-binding GntR family transcriptional regulator
VGAAVGKPKPKGRRVPGRAAGDESARLADAVYERLKADIFEFRRLPGEGLSENEIAARCEVSRTPVREALLRLEREGLVQLQPKSGWSVGPLDFERFEQLYDVRVILELGALGKLCAGDPGEALEPLKAVWLVGAKRRCEDWLEVARLDEGFHAALLSAAGNAELARVHGEICERIRIVRRLDFTQRERIERTYEEHGAILRAVLARKAQQAGRLLRAHIEASKLEVRKISLHRLQLAHRAASRRARAGI